MALKKRRVINQVEFIENGHIQVREADETYDDSIVPKAAIPEVPAKYETVQIPVDAVPAIKDVDGNVVQEAIPATTKPFKKLVKEAIPGTPAATDLVGERKYHRYVISPGGDIPSAVGTFVKERMP